MLTHRRYSTKFSFFSLSIRNKNETSIYDFLTSQKVETTDKSRYFTRLWLCFIRNDPSCVEHVKISFNPKIAWVRFSMFLFLAIIYCLVILKLTTTTTTKRSLSSVHLPPSLPPQSPHSLGLYISTILLFKLAFGFGDKRKKGCVVPFKSIDFSTNLCCLYTYRNKHKFVRENGSQETDFTISPEPSLQWPDSTSQYQRFLVLSPESCLQTLG